MTSFSEDPTAAATTQAGSAPVEPVGDPEQVETPPADSGDDEAALDQLEVDLTAVEQAIETLDRVTAEGLGGEHAAAQIDAAVSADRFGTPADEPVTG